VDEADERKRNCENDSFHDAEPARRKRPIRRPAHVRIRIPLHHLIQRIGAARGQCGAEQRVQQQQHVQTRGLAEPEPDRRRDQHQARDSGLGQLQVRTQDGGQTGSLYRRGGQRAGRSGWLGKTHGGI
jgi:hypothetical protein